MPVTHAIDNEQLNKVVQSMLQKASSHVGVTAVEVGGSSNAGVTVKVRLGQVDSIEFHRDKSLGITVYKGQRKGAVSVTDLSADSIDSAISAACRIADFTEPDQYAGLAPKELLATDIIDLNLYNPAAITTEQALEYAKECEAAALAVDKRITNSEGATFNTNEQFYVYGNSNGFVATYPTTRYSAYCCVIAQDKDGSMQTDYDYTIARDANDLVGMNKVGASAAEKTLARLGAHKIKTCQAPVILSPKMAASFWGCLIAAISGGNLYRKNSFLRDALNTRIFPEFVQISEQPHIPYALGSAPFDSEGVATKQKNIIQAGMLDTYLLSSYSARRLGMQTTGNAGGVHNMVVEPSDLDFDQLLQKMGTGLVVTEMLGDGTNILTGNYSRGAAGYWVENGELAYPVEEITIASTLQDMFANLVAIGNDVERKRSNIMTGSVLLENMMIAGI